VTLQWRSSAPGQYIDLEWQRGKIYIEDGPDDWPRRGHEGFGGTLTLHEIRTRGRELFSAYDGLYDELLDDLTPQYRVIDARGGVVVRTDDDAEPLPTPCRFAVDGNRVYVYPACPGPGTQLTPAARAILLVTEPDERQNGTAPPWWGRIHGPAKVVDDPEWELQRAGDLFAEKYGDAAPAGPDDVVTIRIDIEQWTSSSGYPTLRAIP
jgi:hypothetical protein